MSIYTMGIDVGSTASKCVILKDGSEIVAKSLVAVGTGTSGPSRAIAQVLENAGMTLEQMDEQLQSAGFSDISAEKITVDFAGAEHTGIKYSSLYQGADYFTQQVFIKHGKYMAIFTVSSFYEDITGDVLSQFYGIE